MFVAQLADGIRVLAGLARSDVAQVEVRATGAAPQTVTPTADGTFGAVVPQGPVVATAILRDGTRLEVADYF